MTNDDLSISLLKYKNLFDAEDENLTDELNDLYEQRVKTNKKLSQMTQEQQSKYILNDLRKISKVVTTKRGGTNESK